MTRQTLPPDIDDRYELGELLGTGGSGAVYSAVDRRSGSHVALKILHHPLADNAATMRFEREVAAHARLDQVPGVVRVHAHGVADGRGWLAMDRHETTLAARLASVGPMSASEVVGLLRQSVVALQAIHDAGMLHRDIKPSNLFVGPDGRPVFGDFGVVQIAGEATLTGMTPLSLQWAAPETIETGESSVATDIYSLGTTAFTLLQGRPPFDLAGSLDDSDGSAIAVGPALRLIAAGERSELDDQIPVGLRDLIDDMIAVDPAQRPASASEVGHRLQAVARGDSAAPPSPPSPPSRRLVTLVGAAAVVALAVLAGVLVTRGGDSNEPDSVVASAASTTAIEAPIVGASATALGVATGPEPNATVPDAAVVPVVPETVLPTTTTTSPAATALLGSACDGSALWCEPLVLDEQKLTGDPSVTSYTEVDTEFGPGLRLVPGPGSNGGHSLDQSLPGIGSTGTIALRLRMLVEKPLVPETADPDTQWFQSIATISDERNNQWNVNLVSRDGALNFNAGFFAPEDFSGGASALTTHAFGEWHCVELLLDKAGANTVEMRVNGETLVALPDREAANHGVGFLLSLGPRWLEAPEYAPPITVSDVAVGDVPVGC